MLGTHDHLDVRCAHPAVARWDGGPDRLQHSIDVEQQERSGHALIFTPASG